MLASLLLSLATASSAVGASAPADSLPSAVGPDEVVHVVADAPAAGPGRPIAVAHARHALADASEVGLRRSELLLAEATVQREIERGGFPGAALAVGRWNRVVVEQGIGQQDWGLGSPPVDPDGTLYDLASLTKVVATTTAVMLLVEDGKMELDAPVVRYLPEWGCVDCTGRYAGAVRQGVTIRQLLTHTSGLPAWADLGGLSPERARARAIRTPLERRPGESVVYSDIGFDVLFAAAERAALEPIPELLQRRVFGPLGMNSTTYTPGPECSRCAPTAVRSDGTLYRGSVHDPIAHALGGVAGNAGLFSTAHDLGRFAAMLAQGGTLDGVQVLKLETIVKFTRRQPGAGTRALGWDTPRADGGGAAGLRLSPASFGHTGFTGTSLWVDPDRGTWTVLLANRTCDPHAPNQIQAVRRHLHDWVASAVDMRG
jgi:CubicO group peptidase (beta-lactamase class C family)